MLHNQSPFVRSRIALGVLCRDIADLARGILGDLSTPMLPGERIRAARAMRMKLWNLVDLAVLTELADGATWDEVADAMGIDREEAQRRYAATWVQWQHGVTDLELDLSEDIGHRGDLDLPGTAASLDQWFRRHAEPWDVVDGTAPVSTVLVQGGEAAPGDR